MSFVLDIIVLGIILLFVVTSAKRGFVNVVVEVVGFIAAIILTFTISTPLAGATYDKIIEPPIISAVSDKSGESASKIVTDIWETLPEFVTEAAEKAGITSQELDNNITSNMQNGVDTAVKSASQDVIRPVIVKIIGLIYSVVLMVVLFFIVQFLAKIINRLFSFSIVGKVNRTLGGIIGVFKGVIFAVFFCMIISLIVSLTENGFLIFTPQNIENSTVFKFLTEIIPFN